MMMLLPAVALLAAGCDWLASAAEEGPQPLSVITTFGSTGKSFGQFTYPRALDIDPRTQAMFVIDRSGRIQKFSLDGAPLDSWELPDFDDGYPTGVTVAPDGRLFVADTHNYCVTIFDQEGNLLGQIGSFGEGPGQFINPTDIAFGPDGRFYVSEFGGNDRIQCFSAEGEYLFEWGQFGSGRGEFNRPQSMVFSEDFARLYVCDACNHRIQVFDAEGGFRESFGGIGSCPGEFRYPYGIALDGTDGLLVSEFGNNRLQALSRDGEPREVLGCPGTRPGELCSPWHAVPLGERIFVLDSRNDRVQIVER